MKRKSWTALLSLILGAAIGMIAWITLFMRSPGEVGRYLPPFWSYRAIMQGNLSALWENAANVIMFLPIGLLLPMLWQMRERDILAIALCGSLIIEVVQLVSGLGCFEVDDLVHNVLGAWLGYRLLRFGRLHHAPHWSKAPIAVLLAATLVVGGGFAAGELHSQRMVVLASLLDREDSPNLLVMNGKSGRVRGTRLRMKYRNDGTLSISGTSQIRTWYQLADFQLEAGTYTFSGLSGVPEKTIALELEYFDEEKNTGIRLTKDIGPIEKETFTLTQPTRILAYVGIYPGCDCDVVARPVLYREGE